MPRTSPYLEQHLRSLRQACTDVYRLRGCAPPCPTCRIGDLCVTANAPDSPAGDEYGAPEPAE